MPRIFPDYIDNHIGSRLRIARKARNFTQGWLGRQVDFTAQQIYSYETASVSLRASKLVQLSRVLGYPVNFFVDGVQDLIPEYQSAPKADVPNNALIEEAAKLVFSYYLIADPLKRATVLDLVEKLSK